VNQLGNFEQNLLTELREVVANRVAPRPRPAWTPRRRIALATAGGGLLALAAVVGPSAIGVEQAPAAYAVEANDDGTVTVEVRRFEDADGLERQLKAHGIAAEVDYTPPDKYCEPRFEGMDTSVPDGAVTTDIGENWSVTVRPDLLAGRTLVITHEAFWYGTSMDTVGDDNVQMLMVNVAAVTGKVPPCVLANTPR
jgi:hypothetical protein